MVRCVERYDTDRGGTSTEAPHRIAATLYPAIYFNHDDADFWVDVSAWYEQRVQAELAFASQGHTEAGARRMIETWAGHDGYANGVGLALDVNVILTPPCIFH